METQKMCLLGIAIGGKQNKDAGTVYVEYHKCDQCGAEYRIYMRSPKEVEGAFQDLARLIGGKHGRPDLCYNCQSSVIFDQMVMPLEV